MEEVEIASQVRAARGAVWDRVVTAEGINYELRPWLRMTVPRTLKDATVDSVPLRAPLGRSWVLLLGVVPFDFDDLMIAELEPGRRFLEISRTLSTSRWEHERTIAETDRGSEIRDRLRFEPRGFAGRSSLLRRLMRSIVGAIFRHRHRRLVRYFGPASGSPT